MSVSNEKSTQVCQKCRRPLPASAPEGMCPYCLYENMLAPSTAELAAGVEPGGSRSEGGREFGDYELQDEVARGGMGVVYRARERTKDRWVALKMVHTLHLAGETLARRFRIEAEAAASLDHPHIVPIYDVGEIDGRWFYTMPLMEGGTLSDQIETLKLSSNPAAGGNLNRRKAHILQLMAKVARAVQHAHERGLLHRDLKPSNILLDAAGEPAVADFGLARWVGDDNELTASGTVMGSPSYMSPEQAAGRTPELTTAADVYGLGAVLFYLLTGCAPFAEETAVATMRAVIEREPARPSTLNPAVDREFDTICLKCLEKDPARRYPSARALAEDLERLARGEAILARPSSFWQLTRRWARHNPTLTLLMIVLALTPIIIITLLAGSNRRVQQAQAQTRLNLYAADMQVAQTALEDANLALARQILENHRPRQGEPDLRGFEWRYLWHRARSGQLRVLRQHAQPVNGVRFSPDGNWLATSEIGRTAWFWNTTTWKPERVIDWSGESTLPFRGISFARDSAQVVVTMDGHYCPIFDAATWQSEYCLFAGELRGATLTRIEWSPVADRLAFLAIGSRGEHRCGVLDWNAFRAHPGPRSTNLPGGFVADTKGADTPVSYPDAPICWLPPVDKLFGFTPAGDLLAAENSRLLCLDAAGRRSPYDFGSPHIFDYCELSPNGKFLAGFNSQPKDRHSVLMDEFTPGYTNCWEMIGHDGDLRALAISPDSRQIVSGSADHTARVWDVATRQPLATLRGHADEVTAVAWSPDGKLIATGSRDKTVMLWSVTPAGRQPETTAPITGVFPPCALAADGSAVVGFAAPRTEAPGHLVLARSDDVARVIPPRMEAPQLMALSADASELLCVRQLPDGMLRLERRNLANGEELPVRVLSQPGDAPLDVNAARWALSSDHLRLARGGERGIISVWSLDHPEVAARLTPAMDVAISQIAFAPDGKLLAAAYQDDEGRGKVRVWQAETLDETAANVEPLEAVTCLIWSASGHELILAGADRVIRILALQNGELVHALAGHKYPVTSLAGSQDGQTIASSDGRTVKLWHAATGREMLTLYRDLRTDQPIEWLAFATGDERLLAGDAGGRIQVYAAPLTEPRHD